ncbi:MAG: hypothetical protein MJ010_00405 [Paludibacteraceae bacterium]|nr:hypothetical protein [Paludibacteraceae bacterium]
MAIKKIILFILIFFSILTIIIVVLGNHEPIKRIGDTNFYLIQTDGSNRSYVYYRRTDDFEGINEYQVENIYWNDSYLLLECHNGDLTHQSPEKAYYIIEQNVSDSEGVPWRVNLFKSKSSYERRLSILHLKKSEMKHTDAHIPWNPFVFLCEW